MAPGKAKPIAISQIKVFDDGCRTKFRTPIVPLIRTHAFRVEHRQEVDGLAMKQMEQRATELGASAVIGIDLDYEVLGQNNGMLMVSVRGTAVVC